MPSSSGASTPINVPEYQTQFKPLPDDADTLWEAIEIVKERKKSYLVKWAGVQPGTNKPWENSWVPKYDCTNELIHEWKLTKAKKEHNRKKRRRRNDEPASDSKDTNIGANLRSKYGSNTTTTSHRPSSSVPSRTTTPVVEITRSRKRRREQSDPQGYAASEDDEYAPPSKKKRRTKSLPNNLDKAAKEDEKRQDFGGDMPPEDSYGVKSQSKVGKRHVVEFFPETDNHVGMEHANSVLGERLHDDRNDAEDTTQDVSRKVSDLEHAVVDEDADAAATSNIRYPSSPLPSPRSVIFSINPTELVIHETQMPTMSGPLDVGVGPSATGPDISDSKRSGQDDTSTHPPITPEENSQLDPLSSQSPSRFHHSPSVQSQVSEIETFPTPEKSAKTATHKMRGQKLLIYAQRQEEEESFTEDVNPVNGTPDPIEDFDVTFEGGENREFNKSRRQDVLARLRIPIGRSISELPYPRSASVTPKKPRSSHSDESMEVANDPQRQASRVPFAEDLHDDHIVTSDGELKQSSFETRQEAVRDLSEEVEETEATPQARLSLPLENGETAENGPVTQFMEKEQAIRGNDNITPSPSHVVDETSEMENYGEFPEIKPEDAQDAHIISQSRSIEGVNPADADFSLEVNGPWTQRSLMSIRSPIRQLDKALGLLNRKSEEIQELRHAGEVRDEQLDALQIKLRVAEKRYGEVSTTLDLERARWELEKEVKNSINDERLIKLHHENERLTALVKTLESNTELFRELYDRASAAHQALMAENKALERANESLRVQATTGVKQAEAFWKTRVRTLETELARVGGTVKILTDQARHTDDEVRRRAALLPIAQKNTQDAVAKSEKLKDRIRELGQENTSLRLQIKEWEDGAMARHKRELDANRRREESAGDGLVWVCHWIDADRGTKCSALLESREKLREHLYEAGHL